MEKWEPVLWIIGSGVGYLAVTMALESLKSLRPRKKSGA
jgi:hypothetical protein